MERTLFGVVESKRESAQRAQKLVSLYASIRDAPGFVVIRKSQAGDLQYFIDRSNAKKLDPNDLDGLNRLGCDTSDLLTDREAKSMHRKPIWKPYPKGWLGARPGDKYPCQLHPKEVDYLEKVKAEVLGEVEAIQANVPLLVAEAAELRAIGPLPKEIAERHKLAEDGWPMKKEKPCKSKSSG